MGLSLRWTRLVAIWSLCLIAQCAIAQTELQGTLKKVKASGVVLVGYRDASVPFSYLSAEKTPIGYSIDLCANVVSAMSDEVGRELTVQWVPVTAESRIEALTSGAIDLECGSTTNNAQRRQLVAFSPITFVAGTKLLVKKGSTIQSFRDLGGKTVVVTAGTTNEAAMREIARKFKINFSIVIAPDHADSYARLERGEVDAFATDDAILYGLIARNRSQSSLSVVGELLSYEPYGIMYRRGDPELEAVVQKSFSEMQEADDLSHIYDRWFMRRLPSGDRMNMPISPQLENIFASLSTKPE
jgi:ABC-type amino acid transport substrate-binding protein